MLSGGRFTRPEMEPALVVKLTVPRLVLTEAEVILVGHPLP